jgi:beta-1,4-mannosyl-glycoprotein beta-1,4-N-acetylglucosaminyltransferase
MSKIYDCFPFFNELDILEIRLELMYDYVDYFIISECDSTFSGLDKPFYFEENKNKYSKYLDKIIHIKHYNTKDYLNLENNFEGKKGVIYDNILKRLSYMIKSPQTDFGAPHWCRDFYHKELTMLGLDICEPNDIILFGDCDEIPNPSELNFDGNTYVLNQKNMMYYINVENKTQLWYGTIITKLENLVNESCMFTRDARMSFKIIDNAGWHLSWMGGKDRMIKKLISWSHQEFNNQHIKNNIISYSDENIDVFGRGILIEDINIEDYYPKNIIEFIQKKYLYLLKN